MINLFQRFEDYIEQNNMVDKSDKILLTVSGGVDSMVLMSLFVKAGYNVGVAHCNFQLRGEESDEDEVMVMKRCESYGIPLYNKRFETLAEMELTGDSMEMVARRQRYQWFEELSIEHGYNVIAIAHHADDSIETFFINLLRGTGLKGLTGISPQIGKIVRPLTFATRKDISEYAAINHIAFREDSSNRSTKYLRNKIRLGLVPRIKEINTKFTSIMRKNIDRLTDAQLFIDSSINKIRAQVISEKDGIATLNIELIDESLPRQFVVYELLSSNYGFKSDVIDSLIKSLSAESSGRKFYSKEYVAYTDRGKILITHIGKDDSCEVEVPERCYRSYCGNSVLHYELIDIDLIESFNLPENIALIDADKLEYPLTIRRWKEGDWFVPIGMSGRKKVSDFLIDQKVSQPEKERQFVLVSNGDIVWVVGRRVDDRYKLTRESENVLKVTKDIV